jgi:cytochrome c peroxidase
MKKILLTEAVMLALVSAAFSAATAGQRSPDMDIGKALFYDSSFGSNGKSCNDCHSYGDGLDEIEGEKPSVVEGATLKCLGEKMGGPVPERTSVQMQSLMLYLEAGEFEGGC